MLDFCPEGAFCVGRAKKSMFVRPSVRCPDLCHARSARNQQICVKVIGRILNSNLVYNVKVGLPLQVQSEKNSFFSSFCKTTVLSAQKELEAHLWVCFRYFSIHLICVKKNVVGTLGPKNAAPK